MNDYFISILLCHKIHQINKTITINKIFYCRNTNKNDYINYNNNNSDINLNTDPSIHIKININQ